jgi:outer membrane protein
MKRFVWALFFLVVFSSTVYAESPKFGIGVRVGQNFYTDGNLAFSGTGVSGNVVYSNKSAWIYGINGTLKPHEKFSLELAIDRTVKSQSDLKIGGMSLNAGDIQQTPLTLTARFHWPVGIFSPYIGAGLGYYLNSYDKNNALLVVSGFTVDTVDMEDSIGYHINAGSEFFLDAAKNLALNLDFKYIWNKADMTATASNAGAGVRVKGSMNLDSFVAGVGIKYYF